MEPDGKEDGKRWNGWKEMEDVAILKTGEN